METVGVKIKQFDIPVCKSFEAKILNDQFCYEVNLQNFSTREIFLNELRYGFLFLMDYNEDRQVTFNLIDKKVKDKGLISRIIKSNNLQQAVININTIGMYILLFILNIKLHQIIFF